MTKLYTYIHFRAASSREDPDLSEIPARRHAFDITEEDNISHANMLDVTEDDENSNEDQNSNSDEEESGVWDEDRGDRNSENDEVDTLVNKGSKTIKNHPGHASQSLSRPHENEISLFQSQC